MRTVTYTARGYDESQVVKKYIAYDFYGQVKMYEVNAAGYTIREGVIDPNTVSVESLKKAAALRGMAFNQVLVWSR